MSDKLAGSDEDKKEAKQSLQSQLRQYCQANLKRELRPMEWDFRPASEPLPKTRTGKIDKKVL
jgi:acyl-coenzyme A synthetase/AMP-(fatty) acid ligase